MMASDTSFFPSEDILAGREEGARLPGIPTPISLEDLREGSLRSSNTNGTDNDATLSPEKAWYHQKNRTRQDRHQWYHDDDTTDYLTGEDRGLDLSPDKDHQARDDLHHTDSDSDDEYGVLKESKSTIYQDGHPANGAESENADFQISDESDDSDGAEAERDNEDAASDMSSVPSIPNSPINFDLVYALHTFNATVEGQATVLRSAHLLLLDDSNGYWWLVRVLESGAVGYIPAENIETPWERLARLNKYRNVEHAMATEVDSRSRQSLGLYDEIESNRNDDATTGKLNPGKGATRLPKASGHSVKFGGETFVEHSGDEYSEDDEDEEYDEEEIDEDDNQTAESEVDVVDSDVHKPGDEGTIAADQSISSQVKTSETPPQEAASASTHTEHAKAVLSDGSDHVLRSDMGADPSSERPKRKIDETNSSNQQSPQTQPQALSNASASVQRDQEAVQKGVGPLAQVAHSGPVSQLTETGLQEASPSVSAQQLSPKQNDGVRTKSEEEDGSTRLELNDSLGVVDSQHRKTNRTNRSSSLGSFASTLSSISSNALSHSPMDGQNRSKREERKKGGILGFFRKKKRSTVVDDEGRSTHSHHSDNMTEDTVSESHSDVAADDPDLALTHEPSTEDHSAQNLSVLRVFAGGSVESAATFKTVLVNEETSVSSLLQQASQRFGLKDAESLAVSVRSIDGQERNLEQTENPLQIFHQLNKSSDADSPVSIPLTRKNSVGSRHTISNSLSLPAITGNQTNDFVDDTAVKIYLHRKGSQKASSQNKMLTFQVLLHPNDLADSPQARFQTLDGATPQQFNTDNGIKSATFSLQDSVSVAETIESALRKLGVNGVVGGGDSIDKQDRRLSIASRTQYGLSLAQTPDKLLPNNLSLSETCSEASPEEELIFVLRRSDRARMDSRRSSAIDKTSNKSSGGSTPIVGPSQSPDEERRESRILREQSTTRTVQSDSSGTQVELPDHNQFLKSSRENGSYRYSLIQADGNSYDITDIIADVWEESETSGSNEKQLDIESPRPRFDWAKDSQLTQSTSMDSFDTALTSRTPVRTPMSLGSDSDIEPPGGFPDTTSGDELDERIIRHLSQRRIKIESPEASTPTASPRKADSRFSPPRSATKNDVLATGQTDGQSLEDKIDEVLRRVQQDNVGNSPIQQLPTQARDSPPKLRQSALFKDFSATPALRIQTQKLVSNSQSNAQVTNHRDITPTPVSSNGIRKPSARMFHEDFGLEDLIAIVYDKADDLKRAERAQYGSSYILPEVAKHYRPIVQKLEEIDEQLDKLLVHTFGP